jgi:hypothetical protein
MCIYIAHTLTLQCTMQLMQSNVVAYVMYSNISAKHYSMCQALYMTQYLHVFIYDIIFSVCIIVYCEYVQSVCLPASLARAQFAHATVSELSVIMTDVSLACTAMSTTCSSAAVHKLRL